MAKTVFTTYGVDMTSLESMLFDKWIQNKGIAMNTIYPNERNEITQNWLNEHRKQNGTKRND